MKSKNSLHETLKAYKIVYGRNFIDYVIKYYGIIKICDEIGVSKFIDALSDFEVPERTIRQVNKTIKKRAELAVKAGFNIKNIPS